MPPLDSDYMDQARQARDKLVAQYLNHPDVTLIDIGYGLAPEENKKQIMLRIHLKPDTAPMDPKKTSQFPSEIDGIPVTLIPAHYRLENGTTDQTR